MKARMDDHLDRNKGALSNSKTCAEKELIQLNQTCTISQSRLVQNYLKDNIGSQSLEVSLSSNMQSLPVLQQKADSQAFLHSSSTAPQPAVPTKKAIPALIPSPLRAVQIQQSKTIRKQMDWSSLNVNMSTNNVLNSGGTKISSSQSINATGSGAEQVISPILTGRNKTTTDSLGNLDIFSNVPLPAYDTPIGSSTIQSSIPPVRSLTDIALSAHQTAQQSLLRFYGASEGVGFGPFPTQGVGFGESQKLQSYNAYEDTVFTPPDVKDTTKGYLNKGDGSDSTTHRLMEQWQAHTAVTPERTTNSAMHIVSSGSGQNSSNNTSLLTQSSSGGVSRVGSKGVGYLGGTDSSKNTLTTTGTNSSIISGVSGGSAAVRVTSPAFSAQKKLFAGETSPEHHLIRRKIFIRARSGRSITVSSNRNNNAITTTTSGDRYVTIRGKGTVISSGSASEKANNELSKYNYTKNNFKETQIVAAIQSQFNYTIDTGTQTEEKDWEDLLDSDDEGEGYYGGFDERGNKREWKWVPRVKGGREIRFKFGRIFPYNPFERAQRKNLQFIFSKEPLSPQPDESDEEEGAADVKMDVALVTNTAPAVPTKPTVKKTASETTALDTASVHTRSPMTTAAPLAGAPVGSVAVMGVGMDYYGNYIPTMVPQHSQSPHPMQYGVPVTPQQQQQFQDQSAGASGVPVTPPFTPNFGTPLSGAVPYYGTPYPPNPYYGGGGAAGYPHVAYPPYPQPPHTVTPLQTTAQTTPHTTPQTTTSAQFQPAQQAQQQHQQHQQSPAPVEQSTYVKAAQPPFPPAPYPHGYTKAPVPGQTQPQPTQQQLLPSQPSQPPQSQAQTAQQIVPSDTATGAYAWYGTPHPNHYPPQPMPPYYDPYAHMHGYYGVSYSGYSTGVSDPREYGPVGVDPRVLAAQAQQQRSVLPSAVGKSATAGIHRVPTAPRHCGMLSSKPRPYQSQQKQQQPHSSTVSESDKASSTASK